MAFQLMREVPWTSLATIVIGLVLTALAYEFAEQQQSRLQLQQNDAASGIIASNVSLHLRYREQSLERMAVRLQRNNSLSQSEWEEDAIAYMEKQPGYLEIMVLRFDRSERWSVPTGTPERNQRIDKAFPPSLLQSNTPNAEQAGKAHTSLSTLLSTGKRVKPIAYPLFSNGKLFGYLVAYLDIEQLFDNFLADFNGLLSSISVMEQSEIIYQRGEPNNGPASTRQFSSKFENSDLSWEITTQINPMSATIGINVKPLVLFLGSTISLAIGLIVFILQQSMRNLKDKISAESTATDSYQFLDLTMKHTPDLIFVKDQHFRIVMANPAMLALYPADQRDNIIGTTTIEDYDPLEAEEFLRHDRIAFLDGRSETEETIEFPSGRVETLLTTKIRFYDHTEQPFILCIGRKVTDVKHASAELNRAHRELDEFVYTMTHDLKVPLLGLENHIQQLRSGKTASADRGHLHSIDRLEFLTRKMLKMLRELPSFSKLAHTEENSFAINLHALIGELASRYEPNQVTIEIAANMPVLLCNEQHIAGLLSHLINNAVTHNDAPVKVLRIDCQNSNAIEGNGLLFSIKDNGMGVDENSPKDIFAPSQSSSLTYGHDKRITSGLSIARKTVTLYGGDIWFTSKPGEGSTFFFTIPSAQRLDQQELAVS